MNFEGEIGEIDLIQRLVELGRERFTGAIRFEQDGIIKIVYFKGGDVLSASTNDRVDAVDEILLRAGKITKEHLKQALGKRKENESLGDALLNLGFITRKELTWARRIQVIGILRSVRSWNHGSYAIVADYLPKREEGTLFPLQQVLIELFVTEPDRQPFERALDGGSAVLTKSEGFDEAFQRLGLNEEASDIASKIDGKETAAEIAASTGKDVFNTYKLLEALRALGLLRKEPKGEVKDELGFADVGVADAEDSWGNNRMPSFRVEPEPPVESMGEEAPPPAAALAIPNPREVKWGFDEAQIEAAARAATPSPSIRRATQTQTRRTPPQFTRPQPKKGRGAPVFALIVLLIVAAAAFGGWYWWTNRATLGVAQAITPARPRAQASLPAPPKEAPTTTTFAAVVPTASGGQPPPAVQPPPVTERQPRAAVVHFTVQIELVCQQASLQKAIEIGGTNVWSVPISYRGQQCHRVFWGRYETRADAESAAAQIPAALRASKPAVVAIPQP